MSTLTNSSIALTDVGFRWPDGVTALADITGSFGVGRTGLVGSNGAGKSTLLRLIAGRLVPTTGTIDTSGDVAYLPQTLTLEQDSTIAELLGIDAKLEALRAIVSGDVDERHFEVLGDDWDIETRAGEALREIGFTATDLDRPFGAISGGEAMLAAIAGLRLQQTPITLIDEPTNNLDRDARARLSGLVESWQGTLVVVSHDTALLDRMDETAELYGGRLTTFGGPYSAWREYFDQRQAAAMQAERTAEQAVRVEKRKRIETESKLAQRTRTANKNRENRRAAKIVMNQWASDAQVSAGKLRADLDGRVRTAQSTLDAAAVLVRDDEHIHLELPDPGVARGRQIAELHGTTGSLVIQGPERVALTGPNGVGKTTLLEQLLEGRDGESGRASGVLLTDRVGYLSQRLDGLDGSRSALDNVAAAAPSAPPAFLRNQLARLLLRGDTVLRPVDSLSGGERFRVALARLLYADPPAQLLVLDEPTNNLDLGTVEQLVDALRGYRGALLVVSHDDAFLSRLGLTAIVELGADGRLDVSTL